MFNSSGMLHFYFSIPSVLHSYAQKQLYIDRTLW